MREPHVTLFLKYVLATHKFKFSVYQELCKNCLYEIQLSSKSEVCAYLYVCMVLCMCVHMHT